MAVELRNVWALKPGDRFIYTPETYTVVERFPADDHTAATVIRATDKDRLLITFTLPNDTRVLVVVDGRARHDARRESGRRKDARR